MKVKMLILSRDDQYHQLQELGLKIVDWIERLEGIKIEVAHEGEILADGRLSPYDICILCTAMSDLTEEQEEGIIDFVDDGKKLFGIHSATVVGEEHGRYIDLIGGRFVHHPPRHEFQVKIEDRNHPITKGIEDFKITDELYVLDRTPRGADILATALWEDKPQPLIYTKSEGRVFYNALGHDQSTHEHPVFKRLVIQGVLWAINSLRTKK
ncbi:MAG: ThuA domain-containing protein [Candidatus Bathyarchaeota archaeon]|nr:MAG: ThuA domain-containing protein [Candidatus Bathyarchaeota archaeon]